MRQLPLKKFTWKTEKMCENCPFSQKGPGLDLRDSLAPGRFDSIKFGLNKGEYFLCHKTTRSTGDRSDLVCAGALAYQQQQGIVSPYAMLCASLEDIAETKKEVFRRFRSILKTMNIHGMLQ